MKNTVAMIIVAFATGCAGVEKVLRLNAMPTEAMVCPPVGTWLVPATGERLTTRDVVTRIGDRRIVLLTEMHDRPNHHRWQLQTLAALHAAHPNLAVGFEMFPRSVQPVLDEWVGGGFDAEESFLKATDWWTHWGYDPDLYLPLFHFVRLNRLDMYALNVSRSSVMRVAREGLEAVAPEEREGVGDPAQVSQGYIDALYSAYLLHLSKDRRSNVDRSDENFNRFTEAQALRDRAMAETLAEVVADSGKRVAGILGRGHADHGYGVPEQLSALGIEDVTVLTPWSLGEDCQLPATDLADAVFILDNDELERGSRQLGVRLEPVQHATGLRISEVNAGSVGESAGLRPGDRVVEADGRKIGELSDLHIAIWGSGHGGTMALLVERKGELHHLFVQFP